MTPGLVVATPAPAPSPVPGGTGFGAALRAAAADLAVKVPPGPGTGTTPSQPGSAVSTARAALHSIERAQRRLDAVLEAARRGRTFTAQELLVLQAEAYRCAQTLDVASKAVEHAAQSVKQAANAQV